MQIKWKIGLALPGQELEYITPENMTAKEISPDEIIWKGHPLCGPDFQVKVSLSPNAPDNLTEAAISYSGYAGEKFIEEIFFPLFELPYNDSTDILSPFNIGHIIHDKTFFPRGQEYRLDLMSASMSALLYPDGHGFYLDLRSRDFYPRNLYVHPLDGPAGNPEGTVQFGIVVYQGNGDRPASSWSLPGTSVFGSFRGSWYEAARIYRKWALRQNRCTSLTEDNPLRNLGIWVWNRGNADEVIPPVLELQKQLPDVPVALDWYWWHHNPYDTDYPEFWPPREGEEKFRQAVQLLKQNNIFTQVYMNGVCWDMDNPSWQEGGSRDVEILRNGQPHGQIFNQYNHHRLGWMCGEAPAFQNRLARQVRKVRECGLSGQYLDMIGGVTNRCCYNPAHSHPRGGGSFMTDGYHRLLERLKQENPNYPLTTEYCSEYYLDIIDGLMACEISSERCGSQNIPVPLFQAIYHGRNMPAQFGSYALPDGIPSWDSLWPSEDRWQQEEPWHLLYPEQFYVEMIRNIVFGLQPMVCNLSPKIYTDPAFADTWQFILHIARFYHSNIPWLFDGEMLSPDSLVCAEKEVRFFHRLIFTKRDKAREIIRKMPVLMHGVWRSEDGREALFLGNYTSTAQSGQFRGRSFTVPPRQCRRIDL